MNENRKKGITSEKRRDFIKKTGTVSAGIIGAPLIIPSTWYRNPPSDRIRHAIIGTGSMGGNHVKRISEAVGCELVSVCDLDPKRLNEKVKGLPNEGSIKKYTDYRKIIDDKSIDSVTIATPDHWHTPIALSALMAGKHVYIEKPCSHNIRETNLLVKAAKEFNKCVQHGTQRRSEGDHIEGIKQLNNGVIGKVHTIKAINHQYREPIGRAPAEAPPEGVNYDIWLGAAPKVPFTKNRWHYNWRWFWDYGGGDTMNDGVHQIDVAVWAMGDRYPDRIIVSGGQYFYNDDHQNPDTQTAIYEYHDGQIIWEMRLWTPYALEGHDNGNVAYGTEGKMEFGRKGVFVTKGSEKFKIESPEQVEGIVPNFLSAVRANDTTKLLSPIERGAITTNICHVTNIGNRVGAHSLKYDPLRETIEASDFNEKAKSLIGREYRRGYELPYLG